MAVSISPLHPVFVGEVAGIDCRRPLGPGEVAAVEAGMDRYGVLVFRDQQLADEEQLVFTRHFGELEAYQTPGHIRSRHAQRLGPGMADFSNLDQDGNIIAADDRVWFFKLADRLWHSDSSFRPVPAKYSLLSARVLPSWGGNTDFADMRAAYDALDADTKAEIEDLICEHSLMYSRGSLGFVDYTDEEKEMFKPVLQRLVRTHPAHGRKSLYLSSHAGAVRGMSVPEGRLLLRDLTEHATQPQFVHVHRWTVHDLVMWDNRQTVHRVRRYDQSQPRDMRRATIAGDTPTVAQQAAE
jgi:alpha-ketoglutarate-dependent 2,4-dichlorophenoxyacetate dioxygenase